MTVISTVVDDEGGYDNHNEDHKVNLTVKVI